MAWVAAAAEAGVAVRDLAEAVDPEAEAARAGAVASAPAEICGKLGRPQVAVVAAEELVRVLEVQEGREAAAKVPAVVQELAAAQAVEGPAAAGADPVEVAEERVPAVPAEELASEARVGQATEVIVAELVAPARAAVLAVAGAGQAVEGPVAVVPVEDLVVVAPADPVDQALAVAARLAAEVQQPSRANGLRPRHLSAAGFWVEFPAFPECPVQQARVG